MDKTSHGKVAFGTLHPMEMAALGHTHHEGRCFGQNTSSLLSAIAYFIPVFATLAGSGENTPTKSVNRDARGSRRPL